MVLTKEYRICMPLTVEEYQIGQLYMIARHSLEQSDRGEGVEVIENRECLDPVHGKGRYTEKRIHLSSKLPYWVQAMIPKIFYVTEKAWNYYPYTITEYTCSFIPKFNIHIQTRYENNNGCTENCLELTADQLAERLVDHVDIAYDDLSPKHYKEEEDPKYFQSQKTNRGPLVEGWRSNFQPIMCSYKLVNASFEVWGLQTRVEEFIHSCIREVLLLGHRQAFSWIDSWITMTLDDVRQYEQSMQDQTNSLVQQSNSLVLKSNSLDVDVSVEESTASSLSGGPSGDVGASTPGSGSRSGSVPHTPSTPKSPDIGKKSLFSWF